MFHINKDLLHIFFSAPMRPMHLTFLTHKIIIEVKKLYLNKNSKLP